MEDDVRDRGEKVGGGVRVMKRKIWVILSIVRFLSACEPAGSYNINTFSKKNRPCLW